MTRMEKENIKPLIGRYDSERTARVSAENAYRRVATERNALHDEKGQLQSMLAICHERIKAQALELDEQSKRLHDSATAYGKLCDEKREAEKELAWVRSSLNAALQGAYQLSQAGLRRLP